MLLSSRFRLLFGWWQGALSSGSSRAGAGGSSNWAQRSQPVFLAVLAPRALILWVPQRLANRGFAVAKTTFASLGNKECHAIFAQISQDLRRDQGEGLGREGEGRGGGRTNLALICGNHCAGRDQHHHWWRIGAHATLPAAIAAASASIDGLDTVCEEQRRGDVSE